MFVMDSIEELKEIDLYKRVSDQFETGLKKGELIYEEETLEQTTSEEPDIEYYHLSGVTYQFKIINGLAKRPINRKSTDHDKNEKANPFLKNEPDLTIFDSFARDYKLLLNKFPNFKNHFLMVTKNFVKQDTLLNLKDLLLIANVISNLNEHRVLPGQDTGAGGGGGEFFSFFNSGNQSGYSQIHKHIQFLMFPTYHDKETGQLVEFQPFVHEQLHDVKFDANMKPITCPIVQFKHFILPLPDQLDPQLLLTNYIKLLNCVLNFFKTVTGNSQLELISPETHELNSEISYNFIMTSKFMIIIPRSQANYDSCWANSLQFLGLFSGRNLEVKKKILSIGFQEFLSKVGFPNDDIDYYTPSSSDNDGKL